MAIYQLCRPPFIIEKKKEIDGWRCGLVTIDGDAPRDRSLNLLSFCYIHLPKGKGAEPSPLCLSSP